MFKTTAVLLLAGLMCLSVAPVSEAVSRDRGGVAHHQPLKVLPDAHHRIVYRGKNYFYSGGRFYRHSDGVYVLIIAPIGAVVPALPNGYVTFGVGKSRYFYHGGIYYRRAQNGYVVIQEPPQAQTVLTSAGSDKVFVYPAAGQSDEQLGRDKYECHEWAVGEAAFDPTDPNSDPLLRADYQRALGACLGARHYVVR